MYRALFATVLLALPLAGQQPSGNTAAPGTIAPQSVIITSATGEAQYIPDRATISLGVETRALTAAKASTDNATKQRAVIDAIRAQGIAADQISTENFTLNAEQVFDPQAGDKAPKITGYVATNTVRVEVRKIEQVGALIDAAIGKGANEVSSLDFHPSAPDSLRRVALANAYKQALADATVLARALGGQLGELIELSTGGSGAIPPTPMYRMAVKSSPTTPIQAGESTLSVAISARWRLITGAK